MAGSDERAKRLKAQLRANLKRRKIIGDGRWVPGSETAAGEAADEKGDVLDPDVSPSAAR